jgi:uncharacterized RDD family membrane protein YckC
VQNASWARRILALVIDWFASTLVVMAVIGPGGWSEDRYAGLYTTAVFLLQSTVLTAFAGGSFGKLSTRLRVVRHGSEPGRVGGLSLGRALLRSVLICLVIPPLVFRPDGRGLHDMAAGSVTVPLTELQV